MIAWCHPQQRARRPPRQTAAVSSPRLLPALSGAGPSGSDAGAVTAEFATVLPAVVVMAVLLLSLARTVMVSIGCQDAASATARELVAAGSDAGPSAAASAVGEDGVTVSIARDGELVTVTARCPVIPDPMGVLPTKVEARAVGVVT
ncbi:TadE family protein [Bifidobacterium aesculapii]|uniref:TadE family protein n=1 Tax=Bifidobacterium aesculapii TaxID=1329411 RepID=UPI0009E6CFBA|nr:TadE family protein [Bifidobacterium aesculapii]